MSDLRILQFILTLEHGGAQQMLMDTILEWQRDDIFVVVCSFEDGPIRNKLEAKKIPVFLLEPKHSTVANLPAFLCELRRIRIEVAHIINTYHINVLQTHLLSVYDFITPALSNHCPSLKTLVWTFHNTQLEFEAHDKSLIKRMVYYKLYRHFVKQTAFVSAVSDSVRNFLTQQVGIPLSKIVIFENALPIHTYNAKHDRDYLSSVHDISSDAIVLMSVGRLSLQKGHRYLIAAIPRLIAIQDNINLLIVGEGEQYSTLHKQTVDLGVSNHVFFLGHRDDVPQLLACADIFVLPSIYEGLPRVILEAMASQCPIVASNIAGVVDVLEHDINALLIPPEDSNALVDAILNLIEHPEQGKQISKQAYSDVKAMPGIKHFAQRYLKIFRKHLSTRRLM
jgi:glycosyltransferase involved in cell wall biosynthesis